MRLIDPRDTNNDGIMSTEEFIKEALLGFVLGVSTAVVIILVFWFL